MNKENWWKYGIGVAVMGGVAGALAGDITITNNASGWEKFEAEVEFSIAGKGRTISKGSFDMKRNDALGPGKKL